MDPSILALATLSALIVGVSAVLLLVRRQKKQPSEKVQEVPQKGGREVVRVFFGTQTGTAEKFAKELTNKLAQRYSEGKCFRVQDIEKYNHESDLSKESLLIYLVATYGDGEPTDNTADFHEWLGPKADAVFAGDSPAVLEVGLFGTFGLSCVVQTSVFLVWQQIRLKNQIGSEPLHLLLALLESCSKENLSIKMTRKLHTAQNYVAVLASQNLSPSLSNGSIHCHNI
jgi:flavodoxin